MIKALIDYTSGPHPTPPTSARRAASKATRCNILPMGFVLDGKAGEVLIESQGKAHTIRFTIDPMRQTPVVSHEWRGQR